MKVVRRDNATGLSWIKLAVGVCTVILVGNGVLLAMLSIRFHQNEKNNAAFFRQERETDIIDQLKARVESAYGIVAHIAASHPVVG